MAETFYRARPKIPLSDTVLAKWPKEILDEGFCPFPKRLIRAAPHLFSGPEGVELLTVVLSVVDYKRPSMERLPSLGFLAFTAGLPPEVFRDRLQLLSDLGLAEVRGEDDALNIT